MITKQQVLENLSQVKTFIDEIDNKKEEKTVGIAIKNRWTCEVIFQSTKTTYKEAVEERKADLRGADLRGADLHDANLHDANLCDADLHDANLRGADLRGANLCGADLCGANLHDANLCCADLRGANLCGANLRGADLHGADLHGADLHDANLCDAELCNAKFYGRGGMKELTKEQLPDFLAALGFKIVETVRPLSSEEFGEGLKDKQ